MLLTPSFEIHLRILQIVLERLQNAGLTLNKEKCNFRKPKLRYVGYTVNEQGLSVDPDEIRHIDYFDHHNRDRVSSNVGNGIVVPSVYPRFLRPLRPR